MIEPSFVAVKRNNGRFFILATQVPNVNKVNSGLCPHGLPPSACPICSNAAGSMKQSDRNRKIGEMTYHECAMIGNMLKAQALAKKNHQLNLEHRLEALQNFEKTLINAVEKMQAFAKLISNNIILKPLAFIIQNIAIPFVNLIKNIPNFIANLTEKMSAIKEKLINIMDKLSAIFGEAKAFIDKKIAEFVSIIKEKFKNLFKIFKRKNADDDDTKIDDDKKIFNLKTILHKIIRKKKDDAKHNSKDK